MQESQETWVQFLGWEDPLEEGMATHSSILAWKILMDRGAWQATVHGVTESHRTESDRACTQALVFDCLKLNAVLTSHKLCELWKIKVVVWIK